MLCTMYDAISFQNQEVTIQNRQLPGERDIQGEIQGEVSDDTPESTENQVHVHVG